MWVAEIYPITCMQGTYAAHCYRCRVSVCWAQSRAMQKWLNHNQLSCRLGHILVWDQGRGNFGENMCQPIGKYRDSLLHTMQYRDHSFLNNAWLLLPKLQCHNRRNFPTIWLSSNTHTHTQPFYGSVEFVRDNPGEPVPKETFTHSHSSWSSIIPICFLHLLRSMASCLFNPRALQSFFTISLQVFFGLPLGLVPSTIQQLCRKLPNYFGYSCYHYCYQR